MKRRSRLLPFTIGFEFTGIPARWSASDGDSSIPSCVQKVEAELMLLPNQYMHGIVAVHDDMCVEVNTQPTRSIAKCERMYKRTRKAFSKYGAYPKHPDTVCGGGHIHIGCHESDVKRKLAVDLLKRPYLAWAFSEPDEIESCDYPVELIRPLRRAARERRRARVKIGAAAFIAEPFYDEYYMLEYGGWDKQWMARSCRKTFEFRFFEAPLDWSEQLLHIRFVEAYYNWIVKNPFVPWSKTDGFDKKQLRRMSFKQAHKLFREFITTIGLRPDAYEFLVWRNMKPRWENGRTRR